MANFWGPAFALAAIWLLVAAFRRRQEALKAENAGGASPGPPDRSQASRSLAIMGEAFPPLINILLAWVALKTSVMFAMMEVSHIFSLTDLLGFLFLLAAYGTWLTLSTRYSAARTIRASKTASGRDQAAVTNRRKETTGDAHGDEHAVLSGDLPHPRRRARLGGVGTDLAQTG